MVEFSRETWLAAPLYRNCVPALSSGQLGCTFTLYVRVAVMHGWLRIYTVTVRSGAVVRYGWLRIYTVTVWSGAVVRHGWLRIYTVTVRSGAVVRYG
jgi:hypothetical protein